VHAFRLGGKRLRHVDAAAQSDSKPLSAFQGPAGKGNALGVVCQFSASAATESPPPYDLYQSFMNDAYVPDHFRNRTSGETLALWPEVAGRKRPDLAIEDPLSPKIT